MQPEKMTRSNLIDGKKIAERLRARLGLETASLSAQYGRPPGLHVVLVGENAASGVYVRNKEKAAHEAGFAAKTHFLPENVAAADLLQLIKDLNANASVDGILVQLPLPAHLPAATILAAIDPAKDVDGFHIENAGKLAINDGSALVPCTPLGCLMLLQETLGADGLAGKAALIIGRSNIVGKPMAQLLLQQDCTVTIAHSRTRGLPALCASAEILVAAIGRPHFVKGDWVREGAVVIEVGINRIADGAGSRLVGDVDFAAAQPRCAGITPVPGGVGPMTIACLLKNTLTAYKRRMGSVAA